MELICIGDSLTFGYGVRASRRWTNLAAAEGGHRIVNMGLSGDTTAGMLLRLRTQVLTDPRFQSYNGDRPRIMLMGGVNDIFYTGSNIPARENMGTMIQHLLSLGMAPIIGIAPLTDMERFPPQWSGIVDAGRAAAEIEAYNRWLEAYCAAFGVCDIVDFRPPFNKTGEKLFLDGLHPNEEGHRLMAEVLLKVIGK